MTLLPLTEKQREKLKLHDLEKRFDKQAKLLCENFRHPSLHTELLEPKRIGIYSFRIDKKWRALFVFIDTNTLQILAITNHYR